MLAITACETSPIGRSQLILISPTTAIIESETAYLQAIEQLDAADKLVDDNPEFVARVKHVAGRLLSVAMMDYPNSVNWNWSIAIIDEPETVTA